MSAYERTEYKKSTTEAIQKYEHEFGKETFPSYYFEFEFTASDFENRIVDAVSECLKVKKNVFDLGIVPLSALETCY